MGFKARAAHDRGESDGVGGEGVRQVLAAMAELTARGLGAWGRADAEAAAAVSLPGGRALEIVERPSRDGTEVVAMRAVVDVGEDADDFARWLEVARAVLGQAPTLMGGPGPFVRWRRPGSSGQPGSSIGMRLAGAGSIAIEVMATEHYEHQEYRTFEWGEGLDGLPYHWLGFRQAPELDGLTTSGRLVYGWDEIEAAIAMTLVTLHRDVVALRGYGLAFKVGLRPRDRSRREVAAVLFHDGRMDVLADLAKPQYRLPDARMPELGWHRQWVGKRWRCDFDAASGKICRQVARTMRATLEAWQVPLAESNMDRGKTLGYYVSFMKGWVRGIDDQIAALPLRPLDLTSIGVQAL
jgi:hypothetical protein